MLREGALLFLNYRSLLNLRLEVEHIIEEDEIDGLLKRVKKVAIQLKSTALQSHVNFYSVWQTTDIQFLPQEGGGRFKFRLMFHS